MTASAAADGLWQYVETVAVPVNDTEVNSVNSLQAGVHYQLRASGDMILGGNLGWADSEWSYDANDPSVTPLDDSYQADGIDYGTDVNDTVPSRLKAVYWGSYSSQHTYAIDTVGQGWTNRR